MNHHDIAGLHGTAKAEESFEASSAADEEDKILDAAARLVADGGYEALTFEHVADAASIPVAAIEEHFASRHALASAILDSEGASMRRAQQHARALSDVPLEVLRNTYRIVGDNLATIPVVRAGVRLATEARRYFPERRIDPFRTWDQFVTDLLEQAKGAGHLKPGTDIVAATWVLVAVAMGTRDLLAFRDAWSEAPTRLHDSASAVIALISADMP
ncbi:TetR/AcrR family transcriptional regulator [Microbacterium sp. 18062]|uniref:TetR/AcrR family transcriptional regulator n=1 Tax=Microbacterium sp. 18062 TaxID=2681410 RepID=UPI001359B93D|nr:TetR/AcrR family transcriptional regulator [Microbacterium sp. 18062]